MDIVETAKAVENICAQRRLELASTDLVRPTIIENWRQCKTTFPGAFAEYLAIPARNVFKLNDPVVTDDCASFMDALGNACHTALSFDLIGEDVLITGAGPIGRFDPEYYSRFKPHWFLWDQQHGGCSLQAGWSPPHRRHGC